MRKNALYKLIVFMLCLAITAGAVVLPVNAENRFDATRYDLTKQELTDGEIVRIINGSSKDYKQDNHIDKKGGSMGYTGHYSEVFFGPSLFRTPSTQLCMQSVSNPNTANYNFALLTASLSATAYTAEYLVQAYRDLGCREGDIYLYSYPDSAYNRAEALKNGKKFADDKSLSFSIASQNMTIDGIETDILFITLCGTKNYYEIFRDRTMKLNQNFFGYYAWDWIYEFQEDVFAGLTDYKENHPNLGKRPMKVIITGHSLAGGGANLVGARFNMTCDSGEWYSDAITQDDVYCYTFGGLDSISDTKEDAPDYHQDIPVLNGYDNIFNIYNMLDNFGPEGKIYGLSVLNFQQIYGKFGHFYTFRDTMEDYVANSAWQQHEIAGYIEIVENGLIGPLEADERIRVRITGPVDVQVFRGTTRVGEFKDSIALAYEDDIYVASEDGIRTLILPKDKGYRIKLTGTGKGEANYILERVSFEKPISVVYKHFAVEENKRIETDIMVSFSEAEVEMYVLNETGEQIALIHRDGSEESLIKEEEESSYDPDFERKFGKGKKKESVEETRKTVILIAFSVTAAILIIAFITTCVVLTSKKKNKDGKNDANNNAENKT